jgi:hypothetical protein
MQVKRWTQAAAHVPPEISSGAWFGWWKAFLIDAGLQVGFLFWLNQGFRWSVQIEMVRGEILLRGMKTRDNKNAGLADTYEVITTFLGRLPGLQGIRNMIGLSTVSAESPLRLSQVLHLVVQP